MMLEQFYIACLSHASYLIGDQPAAGQSLSTHAGDIGDHLAAAVRHGVVIEGSSTPTFTPTSWPDTWRLRRQLGRGSHGRCG